MKEQNRSIVGWGQRPSEKVTVAMALRAEQRGENSIQRQQEVQAQGWVGGTGVGKTESRPVSAEPCLGWWPVPWGAGKQPGVFGLTFNLEVIPKLQKSE